MKIIGEAVVNHGDERAISDKQSPRSQRWVLPWNNKPIAPPAPVHQAGHPSNLAAANCIALYLYSRECPG